MRTNYLILWLSMCVATLPIRAQTTVNTQYGTIQGNLNGSVHEFLGIPYAKPPVGPLRWKAPQGVSAWTGILLTNTFAPECPQKKFDQGGATYTISGNEDCLYLNIWTPQTGPGSRPVLVFIHGGGNQQGSANEVNGGTQMFFGKNMAQRGDAVVVTIQYRLGPLGFLVHPGLEAENAQNISGNYAVLDQILALTWIKNNIAKFGGDSTKVMIFGESAGGINVGNLMNTPLASGLFQRACIQSAVPVIGDYTTAKNKGITFVSNYTSTGTDVQKIAYLRSKPSDSLVKYEVPPLSGGTVGMNWQAVVDNSVFYNVPGQNFQNGTFNKVPFMIGSNSEEMSLSVPQTVLPFMLTALINSTVPSSLQAQANLLYPAGSTTAQARASYIGILTDAQFTSTTRRTAQCVSVNQNEPVWRYFFTHKHTVPQIAGLGSYHGMELFYVFNTWENALLGTGPLFKPQDDSVQTTMLKYWVNFAATGNPNGNGLINWPQYQAVTDCYLELKATPNGSQCGLRTPQSDLWDDAVNYSDCISTLSVEETQGIKQILLYPNPTTCTVHLPPAFVNDPPEIQVYDVTGKLLSIQHDAASLDFSTQAPGMYFLTIRQKGQNYQAKIIKE